MGRAGRRGSLILAVEVVGDGLRVQERDHAVARANGRPMRPVNGGFPD